MISDLSINQESARLHPIAKRSHQTTTILRLNGAPVNGIERIAVDNLVSERLCIPCNLLRRAGSGLSSRCAPPILAALHSHAALRLPGNLSAHEIYAEPP